MSVFQIRCQKWIKTKKYYINLLCNFWSKISIVSKLKHKKIKSLNPSCKKNPREFKTPSLWRGITKIFHGRPLIIWASDAWVEPGTNRLTFLTTNRKVFSETSNPSAVSLWNVFNIAWIPKKKNFFFKKKHEPVQKNLDCYSEICQ